MARPGMANLIASLRALTNAETTEITVGGETYFSDDHLEMLLDATQQIWQDIPLDPRPDVQDGSLVYQTYRIPDYVPRMLEEAGVSSGWAVRNVFGTLVPAENYVVNYQAGTITFNSDTGGTHYLLDCRTYNLNRAASTVWLKKAGFAYQDVDWGSDNHRLQASQQFMHALHMAETYAAKAGLQIGRLVRSDESVAG